MLPHRAIAMKSAPMDTHPLVAIFEPIALRLMGKIDIVDGQTPSPRSGFTMAVGNSMVKSEILGSCATRALFAFRNVGGQRKLRRMTAE
jgi:hypothetical protein